MNARNGSVAKPAGRRPMTSTAPADTRRALVTAAIDSFGRRGYAGASTRDIAASAGVNPAMIAYHFGSKEGLRAACAQAVAARMGEVAGKALIAAGEAVRGDREQALAALKGALAAMVRFLLIAPEARPLATFVLREMSEPGAVFEIVYAAMIEPVHRAACRLFARAGSGVAESPETRIAVFAAIGQALYFRIAAPAVLRRMGWRDYGPAEADAIAARLTANLEAALAAQWRPLEGSPNR
jgi:AcrR family transcriptional regulator